MPSFNLFSEFLKVIVISVHCVTLSQQKIVRDTIKGISYANFAENDNRRLNTAILQTLSVRNLTECQFKCLNNNNCFSGNYNKSKNQHQKHDCQLLEANKFTSAQQMLVDNTYQHFSVVSPCDQAPCQNGGTCVPKYDNNSYTCQCALYTEGQHCQEVQSGRFFKSWTAFWWYDVGITWPAAENDVLAYEFGHCKANDPYCFGRLPLSVIEDKTRMLAVDSQGTTYKWRFNSSNSVAHAAWRAFHDHQTISYGEVINNPYDWNPTVISGSSPRKTQDSFMYRDQNGVRSILLDDDGCDCYSTLNIGHGMCFGGHSTSYGPANQFGVDALNDPGCGAPRAGIGLTLYFHENEK